MQRVHLEAMLPAVAPAQLAVELAPPDWYQPPSTTAARPPSWRAPAEAADRRDAASGKPLGSCVIELDLT